MTHYAQSAYPAMNLTIWRLVWSPTAMTACTVNCCCRMTKKHCLPAEQQSETHITEHKYKCCCFPNITLSLCHCWFSRNNYWRWVNKVGISFQSVILRGSWIWQSSMQEIPGRPRLPVMEKKFFHKYTWMLICNDTFSFYLFIYYLYMVHVTLISNNKAYIYKRCNNGVLGF